jgi:hypothetical protein
MEITIDHGIIKRIVFETMEQAQVELDKLKPLLGYDHYDRFVNDKNKGPKTHTISAPCGETVVVLHKVSSAGLIDGVKSYEISKDLDELATRRKVSSEQLEKQLGLENIPNPTDFK